MKKSSYTFPAKIKFSENSIFLEFPDLPGCCTSGKDIDEILKNAEEVLGLFLVSMEADEEEIPVPTPLDKIECEKDERTILITTWMALARQETKIISVKKTLTIPQWLNDIAEENKINFSQVLQAALKEKLGIRRNI